MISRIRCRLLHRMTRGTWGSYDRTSKDIFSLRRGFTLDAERFKIEEAKQRLIADSRKENLAYCPKKSGEYLMFLDMNPDKRESTISSLRLLLSGVDITLLNRLLSKVDTMFKYRIVENSLAHESQFMTIQKLEDLLGERHKEKISQDYDEMVECFLQSLGFLQFSEMVSLLSILTLSNIRSHQLNTSTIGVLSINLSKLTDNTFRQLVAVLNSLCRNYSMIEGSINFRYRLKNINEEFLTEFLDAGVFNNIILRLVKDMDTVTDMNQYLDTVSQMIHLMQKYLKIGGLSHANKSYFFDKLVVKLYGSIKEIESASETTVLKIFYVSGTIMQFGAYSPLVMRVFRKAQRRMIGFGAMREGARRFDILRTGLNTYSSIGVYDREIFEKLYRPMVIKDLGREVAKSNFGLLMTVLSFIVKAGKKNKEIIQAIIESLASSYEVVAILHPIELRYLHLNLNYAKQTNMFPPDSWVKLRRLMNYLAAHCICSQHNRELTKEPSLPIGVVDLKCFHDGHSREIVLSQNSKPIEGGAQKYADNLNETIIKKALKPSMEKYFQDAFEVVTEGSDLNICQYKWDALISNQEKGVRMGVEITGKGYKLSDTTFIQKKEMKFSLLRQTGYIPLILDVTSIRYKNSILEFDLDSIERYVAVDIYREMRTRHNTDIRLKVDIKDLVCGKLVEYYNVTADGSIEVAEES